MTLFPGNLLKDPPAVPLTRSARVTIHWLSKMSTNIKKAVAGIFGLLIICLTAQPSRAAPEDGAAGPRPITIGVLAKRGPQIALARWSPTADYLNQTIPGFRFTIVPLAFAEIAPMIRTRKIDFLLANSAIYVLSEHNFNAFRIATLISRSGDHPLTQFGGVIFTRRERHDINTLPDMKRRHLAAVDEASLGGYLMAWRELDAQGLDIHKDLNVSFLGTHDEVVRAVLNGRADVGTVRTDTLERMAAAGLIDLDRIKLLNPIRVDGFPYLLSTRLYPEWPMAALPHLPNDLVKAVSRALLSMPNDHPAAIASHSFGWTVPANYQQVHELFESLNLPPHAVPPPSLRVWAGIHPVATAITTSLLLLVLLFIVRLTRLNRQLSSSRRHLATSVHEQQQISAQLSENLARLKESEEKFVSLAESAFDAIIMLDPRGRIEFWNLTAEKIFGYTAAEALGMESGRWLSPQTDPTDRTRYLLQTLGKGETPLPGTTLELMSVRKDGEDFPVEAALSSVYLKDGWHVICVLRDITRRKQLEAQRRTLETELNQHHKMAALAQLADGISHEINTPIQTIGNNLGFLREAFEDTWQLLATHEGVLEGIRQIAQLSDTVAACDKARDELDPGFLGEEVAKAIEQSLAGAEQVKRIVRSMRVFANPDNPQAEKTNLNKLIRDVTAISRNRWSSVAEVAFDLGAPDPEIECFPGDLSQALLNLLINATQAIEEHHRESPGVIHISSRLLADAVEIRIGDNGAGIPPEAREHIFNPFFSTRDVGQGSGQGLTLTHDVVVRGHRGSLRFETEMGRGTLFILKLPVSQSTAAVLQPA